MTRHHFANAAEPLKEGSTIRAICGIEIPKAGFSAKIDCEAVGYSFAMQAIKGMCKKCSNADDPGKRFWYVICAGQEARDEETL